MKNIQIEFYIVNSQISIVKFVQTFIFCNLQLKLLILR